MTQRRLAAAGALLLGAAALVLAVVTAVIQFPRGLILLGCVVLAAVSAWHAVLRTGALRAVGLAVAGLLAATAVVLLVSDRLLETLLAVAGAAAAIGLARVALRVRVAPPPAPPPERPVLFMNPRSGGGKAERFALADEARARGIEPVTLEPGDDLEELVRDAVRRGATALAMAGGDGSQAIVATIAAELGLPYACIPAGTRNHFALDLGVDRDDVVGALDAFVDGSERRVDLAEVNGRVFVNNVSLGLYADAVQHAGYRDAKLRTLLATVPEEAGAAEVAHPVRFADQNGASREAPIALLISNNPYRLGRAIGSGTRPRIDSGVLGIAALDRPRDRSAASILSQWSATAFDVQSDRQIPAGIDGEAAMLAPPVRFRSRPAALRVRVARAHPGASPSALIPESSWDGLKLIARIAAGRDEQTVA